MIGCHLCGLSSRAIAAKFNRSKSAVAFVLSRWKVVGYLSMMNGPGDQKF